MRVGSARIEIVDEDSGRLLARYRGVPISVATLIVKRINPILDGAVTMSRGFRQLVALVDLAGSVRRRGRK